MHLMNFFNKIISGIHSNGNRNILFKLIFILCFFTLGHLNSFGQQEKYKAIFIYQFTKYIEWPSTIGDFVIVVVGDSETKHYLDLVARSKKVNDRKIVVKQCSTIDQIGFPSILYVSANKSHLISTIEEKLNNVLIIGESDNMIKKGAAINFVQTKDINIKFELSIKRIKEAGLKVANQLTSVAILVD